MKTFIGTKDGRIIVTRAIDMEAAYYQIGNALGIVGGDIGDIALDGFEEVPQLIPGKTHELFQAV